MKFSDTQIKAIIKNNCGDPPRKKELEYTIWLNKSKLDFYSRNPLHRRDSPQHIASQLTYQKLISTAEKLLEKHYPNGKQAGSVQTL